MLSHLEGQKALRQILESVDVSALSQKDQKTFLARMDEHFPQLVVKLHHLYGEQYDFFYYLQKLSSELVSAFGSRKVKLKKQDQKRLNQPNWYRSEKMLGMALYVDLFAGDLKKLLDKIPYLKALGVNYVHLMPLYKSPEGRSDGGYAVSDYRSVDKKLGTERDLIKVANAFSDEGISLVLDFVFNHTSCEHEWAKRALAGEEEYQNYYYFFSDKQEVDEYNQTCREIFPTVRRGSFTFNEEVDKWIWTTFNSFQWDLNFSNPAVFNAITAEMLFLANIGCEGLRLDALAFIWKEKWTQCESLPKAHTLIQAFNLCLQIVAPSVQFKSEAIVHPDEVAQYIDKNECQLSYNPLMMALMWESLATRETKLLTASLKKSFKISADCSWVNYIRCHDDIGWTFDDAVAGQLGINGFDHRRFLNQFYTGRFEGSFAHGVAFQENPATGDCRVCGSLASLAGLEDAIKSDDINKLEQAIKRVRLLNSINLSIGGIPLIYQGDEIGMLNDYSFVDDADKYDDARWVNRPAITQEAIALAEDRTSPQGIIHRELLNMIHIRQSNPVFGEADTEILETYQSGLFAYARTDQQGRKLLAICNFSDQAQQVPASICDILASDKVVDLLTHKTVSSNGDIKLNGYDVLWLSPEIKG